MQLVPRVTKRAENLTNKVTEVAHGFTVGQLVYLGPLGLWHLAQADDETTFKDGMVTEIVDIDTFKVTHYGMIDAPAHGFTLDSTYYLSDTLAGGITLVEPTDPLTFSQMTFEVVTADRLKIYDQVAIDNSAVFITEY